MSYRERNDLDTGGLSTVFDFRVHQRRVPAKVTVVDYNDRRPADRLVVQQKVDEGGFGNVFSYDDHFKDATEGIGSTTTRRPLGSVENSGMGWSLSEGCVGPRM